jgi:hypothetical protein
MPAILPTVGAVAVCTAALVAQRSRSYVSPPGAEFEEGYAASAVQFGFADASTESRTQQLDETFVGYVNGMVLRGIGWRRDSGKGPNSIKRTGDIELVMSHADFANASGTFAQNYKGTPTTVFTKKQVNLPDWTVAPAYPPASFDLLLPFDVPFVYNRIDALLYDLKVTNLSSPLAYHMDFFRDNQLVQAYGQWPALLGAGCTTKNGEFVQSCLLRASSAGFEILFRLWGAPSSTQVFALVGASDPNLTLPNLCGTLHSDLVAIVPIATSQADGTLPPTAIFRTPWAAAYASITLYMQCLALDPTLPYGIALSSAQRCPAPTTTVRRTLPMHMVYSPRSAAATVGTLEKNIGCPTMFY